MSYGRVMTTAPPGPPSRRTRRELPPAEYRARAYRRGPRWALPVVLALVVLAGVGVAIGYYRNFGSKPIDASVTSFHVTDHSIRMTAQIDRNKPDRALSCVLRARAYDGHTMTRLTVHIPPGSKQVTLTRTLRTPTRPTIGEVESCRYA